jgi:hypothetical protein
VTLIKALVLICLTLVILPGCWPMFVGPGVMAVRLLGAQCAQYTDATGEAYTIRIKADVSLAKKVIDKAMKDRGFILMERKFEAQTKTQTETVRFSVKRKSTVYVSIQPENAQFAKLVISPKHANSFECENDAQSLFFGVLRSASSSNLRVCLR